MLRPCVVLLRRGKPRPRAGLFPDKYRRVPPLLRLQQGGQQYFANFLLRTANEQAAQREAERQEQLQQRARGSMYSSSSSNSDGGGGARSGQHSVAGAASEPTSALGGAYSATIQPRLPQMDVHDAMQRASAEHVQAEMDELVKHDAFMSQRAFNEYAWYEAERDRMRGGTDEAAETKAADTRDEAVSGGAGAAAAMTAVHDGSSGDEDEAGAAALPERVLGADYFASRYGYSLVRACDAAAAAAPPATDYAQLDLWGEMPKYQRHMIFLYLVARRRNTYAVAYDYDGKRLLPTYTAGNRGLKGGDRGFRVEGSSDNGHQVTSMYLNDLLPRIREQRAQEGRPLGKGEKIELVVRVMGFYNSRQGAVRAVQDRSSEFVVRYLEDITPFPLNGPKMPHGVFR